MTHPSPHTLVRFQSDWGGANLTRASGWLAQWLWERTDGRIRSAIHNGRGMGDNVRALDEGVVDIAIATPLNVAALALTGAGPFAEAPIPRLRGLGVLPHRDAMLAIGRRELGLRHLSDAAALVAAGRPLRFSLGLDDADGFMGYAARVLLEAAGLDTDAIVAAGGEILRHEAPFGVLADALEDRADIAITEAIMTPLWQKVGASGRFDFLGLSAAEEDTIAERHGLRAYDLPAGRFPGLAAPIRVLDYSGWAILTTEDLDDEVAALIAEAVCTDAVAIERHYRHLPVEASPLTYPVIAAVAADLPIPLHPAAAAVYRRRATPEDAAS